MALGKYSRIVGKRLSSDHWSTVSLVVFVALCLVGVWLMTSSFTAPFQNSNVSGHERNSEVKTGKNDGYVDRGSTFTNESNTSQFENDPGDLIKEESQVKPIQQKGNYDSQENLNSNEENKRNPHEDTGSGDSSKKGTENQDEIKQDINSDGHDRGSRASKTQLEGNECDSGREGNLTERSNQNKLHSNNTDQKSGETLDGENKNSQTEEKPKENLNQQREVQTEELQENLVQKKDEHIEKKAQKNLDQKKDNLIEEKSQHNLNQKMDNQTEEEPLDNLDQKNDSLLNEKPQENLNKKEGDQIEEMPQKNLEQNKDGSIKLDQEIDGQVGEKCEENSNQSNDSQKEEKAQENLNQNDSGQTIDNITQNKTEVSKQKKAHWPDDLTSNATLSSRAQLEILNQTTAQNRTFSTQAALSENETELQQSSSMGKNIAHIWKLCNSTAGPDYIPCLDNVYVMRHLQSTKHYEHRERHCPANAPTCIVPLPEGYQKPIEWPLSREKIWYSNVPHTGLAKYKAHQNWLKVSGEYLIFPGGGTQFKKGARHYINFIQQPQRMNMKLRFNLPWKEASLLFLL